MDEQHIISAQRERIRYICQQIFSLSGASQQWVGSVYAFLNHIATGFMVVNKNKLKGTVDDDLPPKHIEVKSWGFRSQQLPTANRLILLIPPSMVSAYY